MSDWSEVDIRWDGDVPSGADLEKVRASIARELDDLDSPGDLIFHVVMLSDDWSGPSVTLSGDGEGFLGSYSATSDWVSISDLEERE